jgi:hypothetical protein
MHTVYMCSNFKGLCGLAIPLSEEDIGVYWHLYSSSLSRTTECVLLLENMCSNIKGLCGLAIPLRAFLVLQNVFSY